LEKLTYEYEGVRYLTFEVAKLRQVDKYGKTHTAYVSEKVEGASVPEPVGISDDGSLPFE